MGYLGYVNYTSLLFMRCISERNKVGNTLLYEATVLKYNPVWLIKHFFCFEISLIYCFTTYKHKGDIASLFYLHMTFCKTIQYLIFLTSFLDCTLSIYQF